MYTARRRAITNILKNLTSQWSTTSKFPSFSRRLTKKPDWKAFSTIRRPRAKTTSTVKLRANSRHSRMLITSKQFLFLVTIWSRRWLRWSSASSTTSIKKSLSTTNTSPWTQECSSRTKCKRKTVFCRIQPAKLDLDWVNSVLKNLMLARSWPRRSLAILLCPSSQPRNSFRTKACHHRWRPPWTCQRRRIAPN